MPRRPCLRFRFTPPGLAFACTALLLAAAPAVGGGAPATLPAGFMAADTASRATAVSGARPDLDPPSAMRVLAGETADQALRATDADGDPLTFFKFDGPPYMTVATLDPGAGDATGNIHLAPPSDEPIGQTVAGVGVTDGSSASVEQFTIVVSTGRPILVQPWDMVVNEGATADQPLYATDPDGDPLTFSRVTGPTFMSVSTTSDSTGNVHLAPGFSDAAWYAVTVAVSDGIAAEEKAFEITVQDMPEVNLPPVLLQPADMVVAAGDTADQSLTATDPEGASIWFRRVSGPGWVLISTTDPGAGTAAGNIHLAPRAGDAPMPEAGTVTTAAAVSASDGISEDRKTFSIRAWFPEDRPPVLQQPADMVVDEGNTAKQTLVASDPDGDWFWILEVAGPAFMARVPPWDVIQLSPGFLDAGVYTGTVEARDLRGLSDQKSFQITVRDRNASPSLERPGDMTVFAGRSAEQELRASDVDGDPLAFAKESGPAWMDVATTNPGTGSATGLLRLTPADPDVGRVRASVRVSDAASYDLAWLYLDVHAAGAPALIRIGDLCVRRSSTRSVLIAAIDMEGDRLSFSQTGLPSYATFVDHGDNTATLTLAPSWTDPWGRTVMTVRVGDGTASDEETFTVSVSSECYRLWNSILASPGGENRPPVADAGGPYAGMVGVPVTFDAGQSSDPDGQTLRYVWYLGDGAVAVGSTPSHMYERARRYSPILEVSDGVVASRAVTVATIADPLAARAFAPEGHTTLRLHAGPPVVCAQIEPVGGSFDNREVDLSTIVMRSSGTGAVHEIPAIPGKTSIIGDRDENGIGEILACFDRDDLIQLFGGITDRTAVRVTLEGQIPPGRIFRAPYDLVVIGGRQDYEARVSPNPINPGGTLSFVTRKAGAVKVRLFDAGGRLVWEHVTDAVVPAGPQRIQLPGRDRNGRALASGVYFYRVETHDGALSGRLVVMK